MNEQVLAVQRMQDYIEAHLHEEITMAQLARASMFHVVEPCQPQPRLVAGAGNQDIVVLRCAEDAHHQVNQSCYARGIRPEDARGIDATQSLETVEGRRRGFSLCRLVVIGRIVEQLIYVGAYEVMHIK